MIKKNKGTLILTSIVLLIPILIGLILWNQLPEQIPSHWDINGEVDGWSSKAFAVFFFPGFLLAIHWICVLASSAGIPNTAMGLEIQPSTSPLTFQWIAICSGN